MQIHTDLPTITTPELVHQIPVVTDADFATAKYEPLPQTPSNSDDWHVRFPSKTTTKLHLPELNRLFFLNTQRVTSQLFISECFNDVPVLFCSYLFLHCGVHALGDPWLWIQPQRRR